jgi:hypothetical protein
MYIDPPVPGPYSERKKTGLQPLTAGNQGDYTSSVKHQGTQSTTKTFLPELFGQLTDILADLVLEDMRQFPTGTTLKGIDRVSNAENTAALLSQGAL